MVEPCRVAKCRFPEFSVVLAAFLPLRRASTSHIWRRQMRYPASPRRSLCACTSALDWITWSMRYRVGHGGHFFVSVVLASFRPRRRARVSHIWRRRMRYPCLRRRAAHARTRFTNNLNLSLSKFCTLSQSQLDNEISNMLLIAILPFQAVAN